MCKEAAALLAALSARGLSLSVAESCTGGILADLLVSVPGASRVFAGGVVTYQTRLKESLLGVPGEMIRRDSVVSGSVACAMAAGCAARLGTDCALSVTGVAGPAGPDDPAPVGTVWIGVTTLLATGCYRFVFPGEREAVRQAAARQALRCLLFALGETERL